ncbi:T9SS type A sorting domain-containing protein [Spirosoma sp.]|uniref:T9SS type A sorting domain-containing protein n=1 Tax=Spirosoma sp. TaxID=1899569 RepID=UPI003B3B6DD0
MKQFILIGVLTGLLTATIPLRAQVAQRDSDARKGSRLELGRTSSARKPTPALPSQRFSITSNQGLSGLDRAISVNKNTAINAHYRSLLISPNQQTSKATARTATAETSPAPANDQRPAIIQESKEESLYSSDKLWVSNAYPNPADDFAELDYKINGPVEEAKLTLLNVLGAPIATHELDRNEHKVRIATRQLDMGYYLYQLSVDGKKVATKRLLVRHQ